MSCKASDIVKQAENWLGRNEAAGTHKLIIDTYNAHKPLARSYKVKYTDAWCATFVSAVAIKCGATDIIPTECGCEKMIELFKKLGCWIENENRVPAAGDIIFYDWEDSGKGDCFGGANHVGIVQKVVGSTIYVIEGNYSNSVKVRKIAVNGKTIRGYAVPKYDKESTAATTPTTKPVEEKITISLPTIAKGDRSKYTTIAQVMLGVDADGIFGNITRNAVIALQKKNKLTADGVINAKTWSVILK